MPEYNEEDIIFMNENDKHRLEELRCVICRLYLRTPSENMCGHIFCKVCITQWQSYQSTCPCCRKTIKLIDPVLIKNILEKILVQCSRCKMITNMLSLEHHYLSVCPDSKFECKECKTSMLRKYSAVHISQCPEIMVVCEYDRCPVKLPRKDIKTHMLECEYRTITCFCNGTITLESYRNHIEICPVYKSLEPKYSCSIL